MATERLGEGGMEPQLRQNLKSAKRSKKDKRPKPPKKGGKY